MKMSSQVELLHKKFFCKDMIRSAYHLALLEQPYSRQTSWCGHRAANGDLDAAVAVYTLPNLPVIFLLGEEVEACVEALGLPQSFYACFFPEHIHAMRRSYDLDNMDLMHRMALRRDDFLRSDEPEVDSPEVKVLDLVDGAALEELYTLVPGFRTDFHQLAHGNYTGIFEDGKLVSAAGTHFVSLEQSFAMIGNIVTDPDYRRRGLARRVVTALLERIFQSADTVCLNVRSTNHCAVKLYESMGFAIHCSYYEARAKVGKAALMAV